MDEVAKKKSKKEKEKDSKLEKALKVSTELAVSPFVLPLSLPFIGEENFRKPVGVGVLLPFQNSQVAIEEFDFSSESRAFLFSLFEGIHTGFRYWDQAGCGPLSSISPC